MFGKKKNYILGEELIQRKIVALEQIEHALQIQKESGEFLGRILIRFGYISEVKLIEILAHQFELPLVDPTKMSIPKKVLERVPSKVCQHYHTLPVQIGDNNSVVLAMNEPPEFDQMQELQGILGSEIQIALAEQTKIDEAIKKYYGLGASIVERLSQPGKGKALSKTILDSEAYVEEMESAAGEDSIRELVNQLLTDAQKKRASDIHIEPFPDHLSIRYRIDGILEEAKMPEKINQFHSSIISRIKIMSKLDISEHRLPQDGRIKIRIKNEELDLRVSLLPTAFGEALVIRLLSSTKLLRLDHMGLSPSYLEKLRALLAKPNGIILLTGPTGSGKTTTLYACLSDLNNVGRKIITVEDPIEYQLDGIIQMQVNPKIDLNFARGLRHMLRHDPDIMMVGEIRDGETAEIAIRSSMTGHLVFSTLHTNDVSSAVMRLVDLGIAPYLVASSLECVIAQRLVRRICPKCKVKQGSSWIGKGCDHCNSTGYFDRVAIHEFLFMDDELRQLITSGASALTLRETGLRKGMCSLKEDGLAKVREGLTTESEIFKVV